MSDMSGNMWDEISEAIGRAMAAAGQSGKASGGEASGGEATGGCAGHEHVQACRQVLDLVVHYHLVTAVNAAVGVYIASGLEPSAAMQAALERLDAAVEAIIDRFDGGVDI